MARKLYFYQSGDYFFAKFYLREISRIEEKKFFFAGINFRE